MTSEALLERLLDFAVWAGRVADSLPRTQLGKHVAGQLVRCGTSPAPNYAEGCAAESRKDFVHKLSICLKELKESDVWLRLILKAELLPETRIADLQDEASQLTRIIASSIVTAKKNSRRKSTG